MADRSRLEAAVNQALSEIHAKTPIAWVITGGERLLEHFAWKWAARNHVEVYSYVPKGKNTGGTPDSRLVRSCSAPCSIQELCSCSWATGARGSRTSAAS